MSSRAGGGGSTWLQFTKFRVVVNSLSAEQRDISNLLRDREAPSCILVVNDVSTNVDLLRAQLASQGYSVIEARNGEEALRQVAAHQLDLVLLDIVMPVMDGYEVCKKLKGDPATVLTPIIMVTSLNAQEDRIRGVEAGADDFLNKPFDMMELLARVRSLLRLKRYTDELDHAEKVIGSLALGVEAKDPYTEGHCARLSDYSVRIGESLGLNENLLKFLRQGGILHDVGKISIPDAIRNKPGRLTDEEMGIVREHPIVGERI